MLSAPEVVAYHEIVAGDGGSCVSPLAQGGNPITFGVFPNPTANSVTLRYALPEDSPVMVSVFNQDGKLVRQVAQLGARGTLSVDFDLTGLPAGSYIMQISENAGSETFKFVKNK